MKNYGIELTIIRKTHNLTQTQLARNTGISQQNISRWEKGTVLPSIYHCELLANYYGISIDELIGRENLPFCTTYNITINDNHGTISIKNGK